MYDVNFVPWPHYSEEEISAVARVLRSGKVNYWTGSECREFEEEFAKFCDCKYAIALANGTLALDLALYALGIGKGDEVLVTSRSFLASASTIVLRGAVPVFVDVDLKTQNINPIEIEKRITKKTKAIIAVHLAGYPCEMDAINNIAQKYNLKIIEDCAQAHGATYKGKKVGSLGDIGAFSFCQDKIMSTGGEGGMLTLNDEKLWENAWSYKDHGKDVNIIKENENKSVNIKAITKDEIEDKVKEEIYEKTQEIESEKSKAYEFKFVHNSFGTNYRLSGVQAAIGIEQLKKLKFWLKIRRQNAKILTTEFAKIKGITPTITENYIEHAYYRYYAFIDLDVLKAGWDKTKILGEINSMGVPCYWGSCSEIYLEKAFADHAFNSVPKESLPIAKLLDRCAIAFLVHPTLGEDQMKYIGKVVKSVFAKAVD